MSIWPKIKSDPAWALFIAFVFLAMLSMPLARVALLASFVAALASSNDRKRFAFSSPIICWLAYIVLAVIVGIAISANTTDELIVPKRGLGKVTKLLWFAAIPLTAAMVSTRERLNKTAWAMAIGGAALGLSIILIHPVLAWLQVSFPTPEQIASGSVTGIPAALYSTASAIGMENAIDKLLCAEAWAPWGGRPPSFHLAFTTLGTMHDAQRLMVATITSACLFLASGSDRKRRLTSTICFIIAIVALILTCKRGPLLVGVGIVFLVFASRISLWKSLVFLACIVLAAFSVPQVRARFADIPKEFELKTGGRVLMWTKIVPALHREHPYGIGFRALTDKKMRSIDWHVERNRNHVHSVPLQAFVDFSWAGLALWAAWMALSLSAAARLAAKGLKPGGGGTAELVPFSALSSLVVFGLVEYNLADAAVVPLYSLAIGMSTSYYAIRNGESRNKSAIAFLEKVFLKPYNPSIPLRGVELFNLNLIRDLSAAGLDIFIPLHSSWEPIVRSHAGNRPRTRAVRKLLFPALTCLSAGFVVAAETRRNGAFKTLFIANDVNGMIPAIFLAKATRSFEKAVVFAHKLPSRKFTRSISKLPGSIVCVCGPIADAFKSGNVTAPVFVDYGITDAGKFFPADNAAAIGKGTIDFCLLGDMHSEWKGSDTAIKAFGLLPPDLKQKAKLHIKAFREKREIPDSGIIQYPWTDLGDVPEFLRGMDVMLSASRNREHDGGLTETFSQTTVQGMLTALPVIHTSIQPLAEKFDNGGGIQADTAEDFAKAMAVLINDAALRRKLGAEARKTALERYVWDTARFIDRYL